jgi:hypothetical protein
MKRRARGYPEMRCAYLIADSQDGKVAAVMIAKHRFPESHLSSVAAERFDSTERSVTEVAEHCELRQQLKGRLGVKHALEANRTDTRKSVELVTHGLSLKHPLEPVSLDQVNHRVSARLELMAHSRGEIRKKRPWRIVREIP